MSHSSEPNTWDRATLDACGDGYTVLRAVRDSGLIVDWVVADANALVRERWAWVVGDIVGALSSRLNAAADNERFNEVYSAALDTGECQVLDIRLELPAAKGGWRRVMVTPLDGDTVSVLTRDISRERSLEATIERGRRRTQRADTADPGASDVAAEAHLASRAAAVLLLGSGIVAFVNSVMSNLVGVNVGALRATGLCTIALAALVLRLPWQRHFRIVANVMIVSVIVVLIASDWFDHYSRSPSAIAVYPVFFTMLIAWSGLTGPKGAATITMFLSAPALYAMLAGGHEVSVGWQCLIVTMPAAAVLGETLSWNSRRARTMTHLEMRRRLHDPLTGLANRTLLSIQLDHALARARRGSGAIALLYIDIDRFKHINDLHGHHIGDDALVETARRLLSVGRESDTVARIGGDEFVILCEELRHAEDAVDIAQRILDVHAGPVADVGERLTVSIGVAFSERGSETAETLLQNADLALYRAKHEGRARFELYGDALREHVAIRRELEDALRRGIPRNELRVYFQPIIAADTGIIVNFEALARWERPGYGLVSPADFIPLAEETGLIVELGAWILTHACQHAASWKTEFPDRRIGVSVNISGHQLADGNVVELVLHALSAADLEPHLLTLELTESTLISDTIHTEPQLQALRALGVNLAIDDFGTGYSSLTYLRALPINIVKIDQSFTRNLGTERQDTAIVAAIINLAHNLDLRVVAEGVETPEQLATLVSLNCEHLQGYLFAQPQPPHNLTELIQRSPTWLTPRGAPSRPGGNISGD